MIRNSDIIIKEHEAVRVYLATAHIGISELFEEAVRLLEKAYDNHIIKEISYLPVLVKGLSGNGEAEREIYNGLVSVFSKIYVIKEETGTLSKGSYNLDTRIITVRSDMEYLQRIKTLLHETAHAIDFEFDPDNNIPRNQRELIAESVAYVVSLRLGLDTSQYSMCYIKSWLKDKEELKVIADKVQKISYRIIKLLAESEDSAFSVLEESEDKKYESKHTD